MRMLRAALTCFVLAGLGLLIPFAPVRLLSEICALLFVPFLVGGLAAVERGGLRSADRRRRPSHAARSEGAARLPT